jgi:hypothetical protein
MPKIPAPKYTPGSTVIVREASYGSGGEVRATTVLSVWYDHKKGSYYYSMAAGQLMYHSHPTEEKDILDLYSPDKMLHYVNKGL